MDAKQVIRWLLRSLLLAAVVFLPLFQLATVAELKLRGIAFSEPVSYHLSGAVVAYFGLLLPVLLGAIAHGASVLLIPARASARARQVAVVALAPLLPVTVVVSGLAPILADYPGSAAMATLAYGLVCASRRGWGTTAEEGDGVSRKTAM
jgi:hypothetical protein